MKVYVHHNCSSCKKALKWLATKEIDAEVINLLETTPSTNEFTQMTKAYDGNLKKLFNTSGQLYRERGIKDQLTEMTTEQVYALLRTEGMLVKRPFLITTNNGLVGFNEEAWGELLGK